MLLLSPPGSHLFLLKWPHLYHSHGSLKPAPTLDEELGLESSGLTPHAHECLVRLYAWMPFAQATEVLAAMLGVQVSEATARRLPPSSPKCHKPC